MGKLWVFFHLEGFENAFSEDHIALPVPDAGPPEKMPGSVRIQKHPIHHSNSSGDGGII